MQPNKSNLFASTLAGLQRGKVQEELSQKLDEVLTACKQFGRPGEITLKLIFSPIPNTDGGQVYINHDIGTKAPQKKRLRDLRFVSDDNLLLVNPPGQDELPLTVVEGDRKEAPVSTPTATAAAGK